MKVLVCGGRDFCDYELLVETLDFFPCSVIVHGGARGADSLAGQYALERNIPIEVYEADWKKFGRSAGVRRNREMLLKSQPDIVVAFPGGVGTKDMIAFSRKKGVFVFEVKSPCHLEQDTLF